MQRRNDISEQSATLGGILHVLQNGALISDDALCCVSRFDQQLSNMMRTYNLLLGGNAPINWMRVRQHLIQKVNCKVHECTVSDNSIERDQVARPTSNKKLIANRRNALRSTGPRTHAGKLLVRRNAIKHGLTAEEFTANSAEEAIQFENIRSALWNSIEPRNPIEETVVSKATFLVLKLKRCIGIHAFAFSKCGAIGQPSNTLLRYEGSLNRQLREVLTELSNLRPSRRELKHVDQS